MKAYFLKIHLEVILHVDISPCAPTLLKSPMKAKKLKTQNPNPSAVFCNF